MSRLCWNFQIWEPEDLPLVFDAAQVACMVFLAAALVVGWARGRKIDALKEANGYISN